MKEEYLHLLWKLKRIPATQLKLIDGRPLEIIDFGWYNTASGPDFFNGKVKIDGILWSGNIEMHVKSSDWYAHQHQFDPSYQNVVLHVVFEYNQDVVLNGELIPTFELKKLIDRQHYQKYNNLNLAQTWIPCEKQFENVQKIAIHQQLENSLVKRLERKSDLLENQLQQLKGDVNQLIYETYAKMFGLKVNELPFLELSKRLPFKLIQNKSFAEILVLILGVSGFLNSKENENLENLKEWNYLKSKFTLVEMNYFSFKKKGLNKISFPEKKLREFAHFCSIQSNFDIESEYFDLTKNDYLSNSFTNLLMINVQSIFLWWKGKTSNLLALQEKALLLLESIKTEQNVIISKWKKLGINAKTAFESQALLELKNECCAHKKCLSCKIGVEVLRA